MMTPEQEQAFLDAEEPKLVKQFTNDELRGLLVSAGWSLSFKSNGVEDLDEWEGRNRTDAPDLRDIHYLVNMVLNHEREKTRPGPVPRDSTL